MRLKTSHAVVLVVVALVAVALFYRVYRIEAGRAAFERLGCAGCHMAGGAPSLARVGAKYDRATLRLFIANPEAVYTQRGHRPLNPGYSAMSAQKATAAELENLSWFLSASH